MYLQRKIAILRNVTKRTHHQEIACQYKDNKNQRSTSATRAKTEAKADADSGSSLLERQQAHLHSLRTKYGDGISGCAEQVITLVDYYRDFERRIDLNETWKAKVNKLSKIEASMSEYVRYVNLPVHLRQEFVQVWNVY